MSGKFNNRTLLIVVLILGTLFVITRFTSKNRSDRSLVTDIVTIDTSLVSTVLLYLQSEQGEELEFTRSGARWSIRRGELSAAADAASMERLLGEIQGLETEQLVARSRDSWNQYQVGDSLSNRLIIKEGNKTTLDLVVGRFHYQPPPQNSNNPYQQPRVSGKTYVRLSGEEEVYAVEGFLAMSINQGFDRWRDQRITRLSSARVSRIIFDYPAGNGFVAERAEAGWMVAGILADSASMAQYVNGLGFKSSTEFVNGYSAAGEPDYRVSFEGDNMLPQQVRAYPETDSTFLLNSTINPDSWFRVKKNGLFQELFPGMEELISGGS